MVINTSGERDRSREALRQTLNYRARRDHRPVRDTAGDADHPPASTAASASS